MDVRLARVSFPVAAPAVCFRQICQLHPVGPARILKVKRIYLFIPETISRLGIQ